MRSKVITPIDVARRRGFTMLEVMLAMGIFAIGFIAVASIFPVAVLLQKQTSDDSTSQTVARNASAMLEVRGLSDTALGTAMDTAVGSSVWNTNQRVYRIPPTFIDPPGTWTLADRSYPTAAFSNADERQFYWVPLVLDDNPDPTDTSWRVFVFVLRRGDNATYDRSTNGATQSDWVNYFDGWEDVNISTTVDAGDYWVVPGVRRVTVSESGTDSTRLDFDPAFNNDLDGDGVGEQIGVGDEVLDNNGNIYKVVASDATGFNVDGYVYANPNTIDEVWYSPPSDSGRRSPTKRIIQLSDVVN